MEKLDASAYWQSYYADEFVFGLGTEKIIERLRQVPAVKTWIDVGSGSESLLWGCAIDAGRLMAVDADGDRLAQLRKYAATSEPRGAYQTVLELSGRTASDWSAVCATLHDTRQADCLTGVPPVSDRAELVTQFGLLGLCPNDASFIQCFTALAKLALPGGWLAGANWMALEHAGRVVLTESLYMSAFRECGAEVVELNRIESADPAYPHVWSYLARIPEITGRRVDGPSAER